MTHTPYSDPISQFIDLGDPRALERDPAVWLDYVEYFQLTSAHVPELIRMCTDEALNNGEAPELWAPLHAWRALGQLRAAAAAEPLIGLLIEQHDDDWAGEDLPVVLGMIGESALAPVIAALPGEYENEFTNANFSEALEQIARSHPHLKTRCLEALGAQLKHFKQNDETFNAFLVLNIVNLQGNEYLSLIEQAYADECVDISVLGDYEDVEIELGLKAERTTPPPQFTWGPASVEEDDEDEDPDFEVFTDEEEDGLLALLESTADPTEAMSLYMLEGYLYGIVITPAAILPSEWLPAVFGDTGLALGSAEEVQARMSVLFATYNRLNRLNNEGRMPAPSLAGIPLDELITELQDELSEWCEGFLQAFTLRLGLWQAGSEPTPEGGDPVSTAVLMLGMLVDPDNALKSLMEGNPEANWSEEKKQKTKIELTALAIKGFPSIIAEFVSLSKRLRSEHKFNTAITAPPLRAGPKVGRNDPCPCGSGKKYKKCCLH